MCGLLVRACRLSPFADIPMHIVNFHVSFYTDNTFTRISGTSFCRSGQKVAETALRHGCRYVVFAILLCFGPDSEEVEIRA